MAMQTPNIKTTKDVVPMIYAYMVREKLLMTTPSTPTCARTISSSRWIWGMSSLTRMIETNGSTLPRKIRD